ncbi:MAG: TonB-dependent receptor [Pseudomonadota bacterium]
MQRAIHAVARPLAIFMFFLAGHGRAAETDVLSESEFFQEMPVVLSASRLSQPASDSPTAITVIDRDMIEASGFRQVADLFRLVPGFNVTYNNGHQAMVTYHGLADEYARRMQVLIDGRSVYMPPYGGVAWEDLPLAMEDIERIEVIRGPSAATHGANSFLGVINIFTRHPSQQHGTYLSVTQGGYGVGDGLVRYGGNSGALDYRFTVGYRSDYGMDDYYQGAQLVYDPQRVHLFNMRADYQINTRDALQFSAGYNGGLRGVGSKHPQVYNYFRDLTVDAHFEQLRWQRNLDMGEELLIQFYHNYRRTHDLVLSDPAYAAIILGQQIIDASDISQRYDLEVQHTFSLARQWRMVWGGSVRLDQSISPTFFRQEVQMHQQRLFAHAEWNGNGKVVVNAGAMLEHNDMTGSETSPRVSVNYHFMPRHTLRASLSRAYRTPVFLEAYNNRHFDVVNITGRTIDTYVPATGLQVEEILSREIGYVGEIPEAKLLLDFKVYRDQVGRLIDQIAVPAVAPYSCPFNAGGLCITFANLDSVTETGLEGQIKYQPSRDTQITANFAHTLINGTNVADTIAGKPGDFRLSHSAPVNSVSLLAAHRFAGGFSASAGYYQQGEMRWLGSGERIDLYRRVDLRLAQAFGSGKSKGELALVIQNLFHENYSELRQEFRFPANSYVTLKLEL